MRLETIKVADAKRSETNPRPDADFKGPAFDDLVASIKEKGVLVPVLARALTGKNRIGKWEVIAGNRRLAAAKAAGLEEIPAQIVEMGDQEAMEAQIVENLQRQDIHPLEEGEAYRKLLEAAGKTKYEVKDIAAKVGKSETYVRQRLFLTNMGSVAAKAYRAGEITDGAAVMIARLSEGDQASVMAEIKDNPWRMRSIGEIKEWIEENIYSPLEEQPWVGKPELEAIVGPCVECKPNTMGLFEMMKTGACTDKKCWKRKMDAYIGHIAKAEQRTRVSSEYGSPEKGVKSKSEYTLVGKTSKDRCESVHGAVIAQGTGIGKRIDVCTDPKCKTHGRHSEYEPSPKELAKRKEERKKEIAKAKRNAEAREKRLADALAKVKWPLTEKHLDAFLALSMDQASANVWRGVAKRHGLEVKKEKTTWGAQSYNYQGAVKKWAAGLKGAEKARLAFELLIDTGYDSLREGVGKL